MHNFESLYGMCDFSIVGFDSSNTYGFNSISVETRHGASVQGEKIAGAIYAAVGEIEIYLIGAVDIEKEKQTGDSRFP